MASGPKEPQYEVCGMQGRPWETGQERQAGLTPRRALIAGSVLKVTGSHGGFEARVT